MMVGMDVQPKERYSNKPEMVPRARRGKEGRGKVVMKGREVMKEREVCAVEQRVPGTGMVYVKTWGCAHNRCMAWLTW